MEFKDHQAIYLQIAESVQKIAWEGRKKTDTSVRELGATLQPQYGSQNL